MRFSKWAPAMGWREFVDEIVIVILGVLIALSVGRLADGIDWNSRGAKTRAALRGELADALTNLETRQAVAPCLQRRLDAMAALLDQARASGRLPAIPDIGRPPGANWESGIWQVAVDSDTAAYLPIEQLNALSLVYSNIGRLQQRNDREREAWAQLATLSGSARTLAPGEEADLRAVLNVARDMAIRMDFGSRWMPRKIREAGLAVTLSPRQRRDVEQARVELCAVWPPRA